MADPIRGFFESRIGLGATPIYTDLEAEQRYRLQTAACALLLEMAYADDEFSDAERAHVDDVIRRYFGLDEDGARALLALSETERAHGSQLHEFADLIRDEFDHVQKTHLLEVLWGLALSDGEIAQHETWMMDRIAHLLGMEPGELALARQRVEGKGSGGAA
jgi:uncharacterized tellurite resistance protein B-like protein